MDPLSDRSVAGRSCSAVCVCCVASPFAIAAPSFETLPLARAAGLDIRHARHCNFDRSRLLCGPPDGERCVAGDDGFHRRAGPRALFRSGGDAADAMARIFIVLMTAACSP